MASQAGVKSEIVEKNKFGVKYLVDFVSLQLVGVLVNVRHVISSANNRHRDGGMQTKGLEATACEANATSAS